MEERYHDQKTDIKVKTSQSMIVRDKQHAILRTEQQSKELRVEYFKGDVVVHKDGTVEPLPFGYIRK